MGLVLVILQAGFVFHGQAILDAAVQTGVLIGSTESGTKELAKKTTQQEIAANADGLLQDIAVAVASDPFQMTVSVHATVKSLLPGYSPTISSTASSPREVFISAVS